MDVRSVGAYADSDYEAARAESLAGTSRLAEDGSRLLEGMVEEDDLYLQAVASGRRLPFDSAGRVFQHFWFPDGETGGYLPGLP